MERYLIITISLLAGACATPAPRMFGAERHEIVRGGITFVVFEKGDMAEVMRMGYLRRPARAAVPALMIEAVEATTGCKVLRDSIVTGLPGDTGEARMNIKC